MTVLHLDFETRSLVDLTDTTTSRYAEDPSTEVLCLSVKRNNEPTLWWVSDKVAGKILQPPADLIDLNIDDPYLSQLIEDADEIYAHNASFERLIWHHVMHKRLGFADIPLSKWRCTAAMAAMHNLPRSLDQATTVLRLDQKKDKAGRALMLKMTNPLPPLKSQYVALAAELGTTYDECRKRHASATMKERWYSDPNDLKLIRWHDDPEAYANLIRYCLQDVEAEHALTQRLKKLPPSEQSVYELDAVINNRGIPVDLEAVKAFIELTASAQVEADEAFSTATNGSVPSPKCYKAFAEWVNAQGVKCDGVSAGAIEELLSAEGLPANVRTALEIAQATNKSSTAKYKAMLNGASFDGRIRDTLLYHGAGTGRWSGKQVQMQNLPRGSFSDVNPCIEAVTRREFDYVEMMWGSPMAAASTCIRGMIKSAPGHDLIAADFSAIEGRVLAWLAGEESVLDIYREGKNPYCAVAADCFGVPYQTIFDGHKNGDAEMTKLRQKGKTGDLACGFGGGKNAVKRFAPDMPANEAADLVRRWREAHPKTKEFWYALTDAAASAIRTPEKPFFAGKVCFMYRRDYGFLMMKLPSGRILYYAFPECRKEWIGTKVAARKARVSPGTKWRFADMEIWYDGDKVHILPDGEEEWAGDFDDPKLWEKETYRVQAWVVDGVTKKWVQRDLSHLVLSENSCQAVARDLLVSGIRNVEAAGYPVIFHVHDEIVAEVPEGFGSVEEFESLMCKLPPWAGGLPIKAEGWRAKRFRK